MAASDRRYRWRAPALATGGRLNRGNLQQPPCLGLSALNESCHTLLNCSYSNAEFCRRRALQPGIGLVHWHAGLKFGFGRRFIVFKQIVPLLVLANLKSPPFRFTICEPEISLCFSVSCFECNTRAEYGCHFRHPYSVSILETRAQMTRGELQWIVKQRVTFCNSVHSRINHRHKPKYLLKILRCCTDAARSATTVYQMDRWNTSIFHRSGVPCTSNVGFKKEQKAAQPLVWPVWLGKKILRNSTGYL